MISGPTTTPRTALRSFGDNLTSPKAAAVPMTVAAGAATAATWNELATASSHWGDVKNRSYHCRDHPGGGNWKVEPEDKLIGTTSRVGIVRYPAMTVTTVARNQGRRLIGVP